MPGVEVGPATVRVRAIDLVCDEVAASGAGGVVSHPDDLFEAAVGIVAGTSEPVGAGEATGAGEAAGRARRIQRRPWHPVPGWDPAVATVAELPPDWNGVISYQPEATDGLSSWLVDPLMAALATSRRPLLLLWRLDASLPLDRVHALLEDHVGVTVVVAVNSDQHPGLLVCLAAAAPRLLFATCELTSSTLLRLADAIGPQRLVFASAHPRADPTTEYHRISDLGFADDDVADVLSGTARALLGGRQS